MTTKIRCAPDPSSKLIKKKITRLSATRCVQSTSNQDRTFKNSTRAQYLGGGHNTYTIYKTIICKRENLYLGLVSEHVYKKTWLLFSHRKKWRKFYKKIVKEAFSATLPPSYSAGAIASSLCGCFRAILVVVFVSREGGRSSSGCHGYSSCASF